MRLDVRTVWTADVGAFVPIEAEPMEIDEGLSIGAWLESRPVDVLHAQHGAASLRPGPQPRQQVRPCIADMLRPRRRRRQPTDFHWSSLSQVRLVVSATLNVQ